MLAAKRDPFHPGANDHYSPKAPRLTRALSALQIIGTLLAVPVGLGSAYSVYRANFSVETTCQNLRANIVAMLDRNVDPNARHMLVRRDVEAFEQACREFDPDATAAFRTLLAVDKKVPAGSAPAAAAVPSKSDAVGKSEVKVEPKIDSKTEAKTETVIRRVETRPALAAKQPTAAPPAAEARPTQRDLAASDAAWLSAVRQALVKNEPDPSRKREPAPAAIASMPPVAAPAPQTVAPPSLEKRSLGELRTPAPQAAPPISLAAPAPDAAPALPPAPVANAALIDDGHPVPPEAIPDAAPAFAEKPASRSRIGALIAKIPFVGSALER